MKATDSVCDLMVTFAFIVFTQAGNVLMGTPTIVRTRGAALCGPDGTYSTCMGFYTLYAQGYMLTHTVHTGGDTADITWKPC